MYSFWGIQFQFVHFTWWVLPTIYHMLLLLSLQSCPTLCDPIDAAHQAPPSLGFSRQEHWSGLPFPSPTHESEKWKWSLSVASDSSRPHGLQPTRLFCPQDFPGESTGVGCYYLLRHISYTWHVFILLHTVSTHLFYMVSTIYHINKTKTIFPMLMDIYITSNCSVPNLMSE